MAKNLANIIGSAALLALLAGAFALPALGGDEARPAKANGAAPSAESAKDDVVAPAPYAEPLAADAKLRASAKEPLPQKPPAVPFYEALSKDSSQATNVELAFEAASVADIVPAFAKLLKFNYMIDPSVKGAVTMSANAKLTPLELWKIFEQTLWLSGAYCSLENSVVHVLPFSKMPQERRMLAGHEPLSNVEAALLPVRNAASKELVERIKPFLTEGASALDIPHQNAILVVEAPSNMPKLRELAKLLDRKNKADWPQAVLRCENVPVSRVKSELSALLPVLGFPVTVDNAVSEPGSIHLTGVDRLQALVATAANQEALNELTHWVSILDRSDVGEQERLYVYRVESCKSEELAQALSAVFNVEGSSLAASSSSSTPLGSQSKPKASETKGQQERESFKSGAQKLENGPGSVFESPVKVFVDSAQNRLLIKTVPRVYAMIRAVLERLDTPPSQVLLQVTIAEISLDDTTSFGMEFSDKVTGDSASSLFGTNYSNLNPGSSKDYGGKFYIFNPNDPSEKFGYIKGLAGINRLKLLSSPQVVVSNNVEAKINVGKRIPILTSQITDTSSTTTSNTSLLQSIQYQPTGVILTITPHITKKGLISMDVQQEVSDAITNTVSSIDSPVITERTIKTSLSLRDGSTLFIAGMIQEKAVENTSTIPFLSNFGFLSKMFGSNEFETARTELVVMITGKIVVERSDVEEMIKRYRQAMELIGNSEKPEAAKDAAALAAKTDKADRKEERSWWSTGW